MLTITQLNQQHAAVQSRTTNATFGDRALLNTPPSASHAAAGTWQAYTLAANGPLFGAKLQHDLTRYIPGTPYAFGTAGHRPGLTKGEKGVMLANHYGEQNVNAITHATADWLWKTHSADSNLPPLVVAGRDTRELSRKLSPLQTAILLSRGIDVLEVKGAVSTPLASFAVSHSELFDEHKRQAKLALLETASHNDYREGGKKILGQTGVNAQDTILRDIETFQTTPALHAERPAGRLQQVDPVPAYIASLKTLFNKADFSELGSIPLDVHYGAGAPMSKVLKAFGVEHKVMRSGLPPRGYANGSEPKVENLGELIAKMKAASASGHPLTMGIALDGDADRFAAVDEQGNLISVTDCLLLALDYLMDKQGKSWEGMIGRSHGTSRVLDALYLSKGGNDAGIYETPVGFKWYERLFDQHHQNVILAMESSGGATSGRHSVQEKDGLFMDLVLLAAANKAKKDGYSVSKKIELIKENLKNKYSFKEEGISLPNESAKQAALSQLDLMFQLGGSIGTFAIDTELSQRKAKELKDRNGNANPDGYKFYLDGGKHWVLVRPSGTEPKLRIYVDASGNTEDEAKATQEAILKAIQQELGVEKA